VRCSSGFAHGGAAQTGCACDDCPAPAATTAPAAATTAPAAATVAPTVATIQNITLRQIGTGVSAINEIRDQAQKDLGFQINMRALSTDENNQIAITQPKQYDIFDGEYFSLPLVVPSGNLQPLDVRKITEFDKIVGTFRNGKLTPGFQDCPGHGPAQSHVSASAGFDEVRFRADSVGDAHSDAIQRGYARLPARPGRSKDRVVGRVVQR